MPRLCRLLSAALALCLFAAAPASAKSFERPYLKQEAARTQSEIVRSAQPRDRAFADWVKEGVEAAKTDDWRAVYAAFGNALALDPESEQAWRNYAVALLRMEPKDSEVWDFPRKARAAAFRAYELSGDAKAEARALAILAEAFARGQDWRPALDAYKESLRLANHPEVRAEYQAMREEHGFRVVNYEVDADTASPRACLNFSEQLARGRIDYSTFVTVTGMEKPAVTADGDKICVDGLEHGRTYEINVRAGVPSAVDEDSLRPSTTTVYVRDRKPEVRFTGRNYVLPRTGQQGLPFVSVNVDRVKTEIYRIGDRGMGQEITGDKFQRQLDQDDIDTLRGDTAARVFEGEIDVTRELNTEITTAFPLDEAVKSLEPGIYVMLARPFDAEPDQWESQATQWFVVSDLGLTALSAKDGVHVFVRSLASADVLDNVELKLVARNNEVLATAKSDSAGYARFDAGLVKGEGGLAPAFLTAALAGDFGFLVLTQPGYDLSDRGVEGRAAPGPLDALTYTERGVYRPGESVHVTTLLRDADGRAVENLPLTLVFERPDGVEDRREVVQDLGAGGRTFTLPLVTDAATGTWRLKIFADTKSAPVGQTQFLVEDYVPERLDAEIATDAAEFGASGIKVTLDGRWLYGAPAADLRVEGSVTLSVADAEISGLAGYTFGLADENVSPVRTELGELSRTDADGKRALDIARPALPATTRPLQARVSLRLVEPGGRAVERSLTLPVAATGPRIGVKKQFEQLGQGETANFDVRMVAPDGAFTAAKGLRWELSKLNTRYQWYSEGSSWNYETITTATREADGVVDVEAGAPATIAARVGYGRYRLDVMSAEPNGPATSVVFDAGWYQSAGNAETPDTLDVALDKDVYAPGDEVGLRIDAPFAGKATIAVVGNLVSSTRVVDLDEGANEIGIKVAEDWRPGAYVMAFLHRPLDAKASRMPGRAIGLAYARIDAAPDTLGIALAAPDKAAPRGTLRVPVKLDNLGSGEQAHLVVAAVDVGILNLTNFTTPAPDDDAFAQRQLSAEVRDLYGQLIDGMSAARGRIRTGGDAMGGMDMGEPPSQLPLALFSGMVPVAADGTAEIAFDIPAFNGTVRLMAMAWSKDKLGHAEQDVVIADPVVVTAALPRFLAVGDRSRLRLDIHNVSGAVGDYTVDVASDSAALKLDVDAKTVTLKEGARAALDVALSGISVGHAALDVSVTGPDGASYVQTLVLPVVPAAPESMSRRIVRLAPQTGSFTLSADLVTGFVPGTASVSLSVGPNAALEPAAFIGALDTYPYGCSEQLSSKLIALLYVEEFGVRLPEDARAKAQDMIARVLARQNSNGGFGLWSSDGDDLWLDSYIADVLTRTREKGYEVPERAISMALARLKNVLGYEGDFDDADKAARIAYAHYVLARNGRPIIGDLRYLGDSRLNDIASPLARAQIGAALALAGDRVRAAKVFAEADEALDQGNVDQAARLDYGTALRDSAGVLALAAETSVANVIPAVSRKVEEARGERSLLSTQENAWLLRASQALKAESEKLALTVDGAPHEGVYNATFSTGDLSSALTIGNAGSAPVPATIVVRGSPEVMPDEEAHGIEISRTYYTLDGAEANPTQVAQNTRLVAVLRVKETEAQASRILVVDRLPAGFEIDNPRIVTSGEVKSLPWLEQEAAPGHSEFRDDRFVAAFDRTDTSGAMIAAYIVRAVAPGAYVHPPATAEDMYRPGRFGRTGHGTVEVVEAR